MIFSSRRRCPEENIIVITQQKKREYSSAVFLATGYFDRSTLNDWLLT